MIIIKFEKGGRVQLNPSGYAGRQCHEATRPYEQAFQDGRTVKEGQEGVPHVVNTQQQVQQHG